MDPVLDVPPTEIAPGDIGFDHGISVYGRIVRATTGRAEAHCWVYHRHLGRTRDGRDRWLIAEVSAKRGAIYRERTEPATRVLRVWRDAAEQRTLLRASAEIVRSGARYDWHEIARIVKALRQRDAGSAVDRGRIICVQHVVRALLTARPDLRPLFADPGEPMWPSRLVARLVAEPPAARQVRRAPATHRPDALVTRPLPQMAG